MSAETIYKILAIAFLATLFAMLLSGCGTVSPNQTMAHDISFGADGLEDAGVKGEVFNKRTGADMVLLQEEDRTEFNADVAKYGKLFNPPLVPDEGMIEYHGQVAFRNDMLQDFIEMKPWAKADAAKNVP